MRLFFLAAPLSLAALLAFAACGPDPSPHHPAPPGPTASASASVGVCRLAAPIKSQDACSSDADCGPIEPCHAKECVAKARAKPAGPGTMCTEIFMCGTTDGNHCGCFEGRCALVPGKP